MSQLPPPLPASQMPIAGPVVINGTEYIPALNGTWINFDDCTASICSLSYANLSYVPSFAGNLAYLIIFAVFLVAQLVQGPVYRAWGFTIGLVCGLILEIVGYIGRVLLNNDVFEFNYFVIYLVCLTIGPAFLSASIYLCLSRLIVVYGQNIARFSPKTYTVLFVCCDVISLILQAAGGAISASSNGDRSLSQMGVHIMIAGLSFQVASLAIFMFLGLDFILAVHRAGSNALDQSFTRIRSRTMFRVLPWAIVLATLTIFTRCCFRVAELKDGFNAALANNQTAFMILEGPMIMVAALALTVFHPAFCFGGAQSWRSADWTWKTNKDYNSSIRSGGPSSIAFEEQKLNRVTVQSEGSDR